jgi:hypothetical protein
LVLGATNAEVKELCPEFYHLLENLWFQRSACGHVYSGETYILVRSIFEYENHETQLGRIRPQRENFAHLSELLHFNRPANGRSGFQYVKRARNFGVVKSPTGQLHGGNPKRAQRSNAPRAAKEALACAAKANPPRIAYLSHYRRHCRKTDLDKILQNSCSQAFLGLPIY